LLKAELERVEANQPMPQLDTTRYSLPRPSSVPGSDQEWQTAIQNAQAQLEHQKLRYVRHNVDHNQIRKFLKANESNTDAIVRC
jgi:hypothetical protein